MNLVRMGFGLVVVSMLLVACGAEAFDDEDDALDEESALTSQEHKKCPTPELAKKAIAKCGSLKNVLHCHPGQAPECVKKKGTKK